MLCHLPMDLLGCCTCTYDLVDSVHVYIVLVWVYAAYVEKQYLFQLKDFSPILGLYMYHYHVTFISKLKVNSKSLCARVRARCKHIYACVYTYAHINIVHMYTFTS